MKALLAATAVALAVQAVPAVAAVRIDGHGSGHGVGMAQWGAMGYARVEHRDASWILAHYYPGTRRAAASPARIRVRLAAGPSASVALATAVHGAGGRTIRLDAARTYRLTAWRTASIEVVDTRSGRPRAHMTAPVRLTGDGPLRLRGRGDNGIDDGRYRGVLVVGHAPEGVTVVDDVGLERYLRGVVPAEMPASWPAAALRAQAIAARSFALTSLRPADPFDVFSDTRSQVYGGVAVEQSATTAAVDATRATVLMAGTAIAHTLFHSSSGGRTAAIEDAFGGAPMSWLRSVDDPYDRLSPYHDWTVTLSDADAAALLTSVLSGDLVEIAVVATTPTGRAATVRVTGTLGVRDVDALTFRRMLGLRSTWFTIATSPTRSLSAAG